MHKFVKLTGIIRTGAQEVECKIMAKKVFLPGSSEIYEYAEYDIQSTSQRLPEGRYELLVNGRITPIRYYCGRWLFDDTRPG